MRPFSSTATVISLKTKKIGQKENATEMYDPRLKYKLVFSKI